MVYDFIEGAAGREVGVSRNEEAFDNIMLQPRVMENVSERSLKTSILDQSFDMPFGVAPMGMCNLACPNADKILINEDTLDGMDAKSSLDDLNRKMLKFAKELQFEQAALLRDKIRIIEESLSK